MSVNTTGHVNWTGYIYNPSTSRSQGALYVKKQKPGSGSYWGYGIMGLITSGTGYAVGIRAQSYSSTAKSSGRSYGLLAYAGNATSGYNYAVYGRLLGSNNGAGIYGTMYGDVRIPGKYAGYFYGNTKVVGTLWVNSIAYTSDKNSKKEIKELNKDVVKKLKKVKAVKYKYKTPRELGLIGKEITDTLPADTKLYDEKFYAQEHFGLIAQDLQKVYPQLVKKSQEGFLGIDYIGLIPVLIEAIKEQQNSIEELIENMEDLKENNYNLLNRIEDLENE